MEITQQPTHENRWTDQNNATKYFVIHWIVGRQSYTDEHFTNAQSQESYHYTVSSEGEIHQHVDSDKVAHHAGDWQANTESIGIALEGGWLENGERVKPSEKAHKATAELVKKLARQHEITVSKDTVKPHHEVRPKPTECPGSTDINYLISMAEEKKYNLNVTDVRQEIAEMYLSVYKVPPRMIHIKYEQKRIMGNKANNSEKKNRLERLRNVYVAAQKNEDAEKDYIKHHWNPYSYVWSHGGLRELYGIKNRKQVSEVVEKHWGDLIRHYIDYGIPEDHGDELTESIK